MYPHTLPHLLHDPGNGGSVAHDAVVGNLGASNYPSSGATVQNIKLEFDFVMILSKEDVLSVNQS